MKPRNILAAAAAVATTAAIATTACGDIFDPCKGIYTEPASLTEGIACTGCYDMAFEVYEDNKPVSEFNQTLNIEGTNDQGTLGFSIYENENGEYFSVTVPVAGDALKGVYKYVTVEYDNTCVVTYFVNGAEVFGIDAKAKIEGYIGLSDWGGTQTRAGETRCSVEPPMERYTVDLTMEFEIPAGEESGDAQAEPKRVLITVKNR